MAEMCQETDTAGMLKNIVGKLLKDENIDAVHVYKITMGLVRDILLAHSNDGYNNA